MLTYKRAKFIYKMVCLGGGGGGGGVISLPLSSQDWAQKARSK